MCLVALLLTWGEGLQGLTTNEIKNLLGIVGEENHEKD